MKQAAIVAVVETDVKGGSRRRRAEATRGRILRAAHSEFLESGYQGATMTAIAKRAGVAVQTVYFVFHTKADLISAVIDLAVLGEDDPKPPEQTEWWVAMQNAATATEALGHFVRGASPLYERAAAISEVLRAAALTDPEVRRTHVHHVALQREAFGQVVAVLSTKGPLRSGLDLDGATDVLLTIFGDAVWHQLRTDCGWTVERLTEWMCEVLPRLLLEPPP